MSDVLFKCAGCSLSLAVSEELAGQTFACPSCQAAVQAPVPIMRFLCPSCCVELSAPYELRNELVACPGCESGLRLPPTLTVPCPSCCVNLEVADEYYHDLAGTEIDCPECGGKVLIPGVGVNEQTVPSEVAPSEADQAVVEPVAEGGGKQMAQYDAGFAQKTMRLDVLMEDIAQSNTVKEGRCPYCNTPLQRLHDKVFICKRCNTEIKTFKRTLH